MLNNRRILIVITLLGLVVFVLLLFRLFYVPPSPTPKFYLKTGPNPDVVPTLAPDQLGNSGGTDINSSVIKDSQKNIDIFRSKLPHQEQFKSSSGLDVTIFIPGSNLQPVAWDISVNVTGVNYLISTENEHYNQNKTAFLEAADRVFKWIKSNGADPTKILIVWGDKKDIRDKAQEWLNSN